MKMTVLDLVDNRGQLAMHPATDPLAEDRTDLVSAEPPQTQLAAALEQLVDRKATLEDEVAAVLDLRDGVEERDKLSLARSFFENFGPRISVQ